MKRRGELATLLTIGAFFAITIGSVISSFVTKQSSTSLTTKASAQQCRSGIVASGPGTYWEADCSAKGRCSSNTNCPPGIPAGGSDVGSWCYGFSNGSYCMKRVSGGTQEGLPPSSATTTYDTTQTTEKSKEITTSKPAVVPQGIAKQCLNYATKQYTIPHGYCSPGSTGSQNMWVCNNGAWVSDNTHCKQGDRLCIGDGFPQSSVYPCCTKSLTLNYSGMCGVHTENVPPSVAPAQGTASLQQSISPSAGIQLSPSPSLAQTVQSPTPKVTTPPEQRIDALNPEVPIDRSQKGVPEGYSRPQVTSKYSALVEPVRTTNTGIKTVNVLALEFLPQDPNNPRMLNAAETGIQSEKTIDQWHSDITKRISDQIAFFSNASKFRKTGSTYIAYKNVRRYVSYLPTPKGQAYTKSRYTVFHPHYEQILNDIAFCSFAKEMNIKEVWMYSYHNEVPNGIEPKESTQRGGAGDGADNGGLGDGYAMPPKCPGHNYVLYNYNIDRGINEDVHVKIHQLESVIRRLPGDTSKQIFFDRFSFRSVATIQVSHGCGTAHAPPNAQKSLSEFSENTSVLSNCENWNPSDTFSPNNPHASYKPITCQNWGCTQLGFYMWYFQNMPGYQNNITAMGQKVRNWWNLLVDFDWYMSSGPSIITAVNAVE